MNSPSHGGPGGREGHQQPGTMKARIDQWRQQTATERRDYEPLVRNQIERQFREYSPPWYASSIGFRRDWNLLVAQSRIAGFAATLQRDFSDEETRAIVEHTLKNIHTSAATKWASLGLAGYLTYRGRHTWQFPFYKPKFGANFNPDEATSLFSNKKVRGFYPRLVWHTMRFTAYTAVVMLMVEPVFRAVSHLWTEQNMMKDPRLQQFTKDAAARVQQVLGSSPGGPQMQEPFERRTHPDGSNAESPDAEATGAWNPAPEDRNSHVFEQQQQQSQHLPVSSPSWARASPSASYGTGTPQQSSRDEKWSVLDDDDDDASPVATPRRPQYPTSSSSAGGSAWDRLRRQAQAPQQPASETPPSGWGAQSQQQSWSQTQDGWGGSTEDQSKAIAKEQAQAEFDRMLERERRGNDQENAWRR